MTTYSIRCRHNACRHRRVSTVHPDHYQVVPKCPACGNRKGWRIENRAYNKRDRCNCGGPVGRDGPFPHSKGRHQFCDYHPQGVANQLRRAGIPEEDIPLEYLGRPIEEHEPCPF